jgi:glutathione S-transferase
MKLYYSPGACSLSPHIVLREAGLAFEPVLASTKTHKLQDGTDYYAINPLGYVPMLELDDGTRLREGPAIVQYIADQVPMQEPGARQRHPAPLPPAGVADLHRHRDPQELLAAVQPGHAGRGQEDLPRRIANRFNSSTRNWPARTT